MSPDVLLDEELLVLIEQESEEVCEYDSCDDPRTHLLICPLCRASENLCEAHAIKAKTAPRGERVVFNRTCFHNVEMAICGKIRVCPPK